MAILRIARSDDPAGFILLRSESNGKGTLDIKLVATEGEASYTTLVRAARTSSLRAKNAPCTQEQFDIALSDILRGKPATGIEVLKDLELVAAVDTEKSITLTLRKRTAGITQRLGTITLAHDEDEEIQLLDWCGLAVQTTNALNEDLAKRESELENQKKAVAILTKQLDDLIEAKNEQEDLLLEKVTLLLNEKKLKIRDQQRLLSTAQVDKEKLAKVQETRQPGGKKAAAKSSNKRKGPMPVDEEESDDAFDKMDVDVDVEEAPNDSEQEDTETPDEDETEDDEEEAPPPPPPPSKVKGRIGGRATGGSSKQESSKPPEKTRGSTASSAESGDGDEEVIPPPRQLPFSGAKKAAAAPPKPQAQALFDGADESTESDDEL